jgi:hypothetical protein
MEHLRREEILAKPIKMSNKLVNLKEPSSTKKCPLCSTDFDSKLRYREHYNLCKTKFDIKQSPNTKISEILATSNEDLIKLVHNLVGTVARLKTRVEELEYIVHKQKKKINILEWLNNNITPHTTFQEWFYSLDKTINQEHLKQIFEHGYVLGTINILKILLPIDQEEKVPFRAYQENRHIIYVYVDNKESTGKYWTKLTETQCKIIMTFINKYLMRELLLWKHNRERELQCSIEDIDEEHKIYTSHKSKVLGGGKDSADLEQHIKRLLYEYLKMRLSGAVEYEFTWN